MSGDAPIVSAPNDAAWPGGRVALARAEAADRVIQAIDFDGLARTDRQVVDRELAIAVGRPLVLADLDESLQRLRNLRLFRIVEPTLHDATGGRVAVTIRVAEKWTTIPIVKVAGGDNLFHMVLGAYDINSFGRLLELGGQYEYLNGAHSAVVWFRHPSARARRVRVGGDLWAISRIRTLYGQRGEIEGGFGQRRYRLNGFVDSELHRYLSVGGGLEVDVDRFSETILGPELIAVNRERGLALPEDARSVLVRGYATLGRIDHDDYLRSGAALTATIEGASGAIGSQLSLIRTTVDAVGYVRVGKASNLAGRISLGHVTRDSAQHRFYPGGLDAVRGFEDGRLRGTAYYQLNAEARVPSLRTSYLVIQHAVFFDLAGAAAGVGDLVADERAPVASAGTGIRLISPRIFRLTARIDYAATFGPRGLGHHISFGAQQFF